MSSSHWTKPTFFLLSLLLISGCSSEPSSPSSSSAPGSTTTPSISSSTVPSETTSSSSAGKTPCALTEDMIADLQTGFRARSVYRSGTQALGYSKCYVDTASEAKRFRFTTYADVDDDQTPTTDKVVSDTRYLSLTVSPFSPAYLGQEELGLDNEIHYYYVVDSNGSPLTWSTAGYENAFADIAISDFDETDEEGTYVLKDNDALQSVYATLPQQLCGQMGLTLESFTIHCADDRIDTFEATFEAYQSSYGMVYSSVEGEFLQTGEGCLPELTPLEGKEDSELQDRLAELKKGSYALTVENGPRTTTAKVEGNTALLYEMKDKAGTPIGNYGYYQNTASTVQGLVTIQDKVYPDGDPLSGVLTSLIPSFNISSLFFDKAETSDGTLYTFDSRGENVTINVNDYGMLAGSTIGTLSILLKEDSVVITNRLSNSEEVFTYTDVGDVSGILDTLQPNGDGLTWSEIASIQPEEKEKLLEIIPAEALDQIPVFGGTFNFVTLDASYKKDQPVFSYQLDYEVGEALLADMEKKLLDAGFVRDDDKNAHGGEYFEKTIVLDGSERRLGAELFLAADYFLTPQMLLYPTLD